MMTMVIASKAAAETLTENTPLKHDASEQHIVIVEDDQAYATALEMALSGRFTLTMFENAEDALKYLVTSDRQVDLILSDNMLPGMCGTELAARVKNEPKLAHIPFIVQTAAAIEIICQDSQKYADLYMQKKCSCKEVVQVVEKMLTSRQDVATKSETRHD